MYLEVTRLDPLLISTTVKVKGLEVRVTQIGVVKVVGTMVVKVKGIRVKVKAKGLRVTTLGIITNRIGNGVIIAERLITITVTVPNLVVCMRIGYKKLYRQKGRNFWIVRHPEKGKGKDRDNGVRVNMAERDTILVMNIKIIIIKMGSGLT